MLAVYVVSVMFADSCEYNVIYFILNVLLLCKPIVGFCSGLIFLYSILQAFDLEMEIEVATLLLEAWCFLYCTYFISVIAVFGPPLLLIFLWNRYSKHGLSLRAYNLSFYYLAVVYIIATLPVAATVAFSISLLPINAVFMFILYTYAFIAYVNFTVRNVHFLWCIWGALLK
jgi:hypothetical protein